MDGYQRKTATPLLDVQVMPPDEVVLPPTPATATIGFGFPNVTTFAFNVKSQGYACGYLSGTVREDLTERKIFGQDQKKVLLSGDPNLIYINGNRIIDTKGFVLGLPQVSTYAGYNVGQTFLHLKQKLYIRMFDPCGNPHNYPLSPEFNVDFKKATGTTFTITISP